jgi:hypothetical protein
MTPPRPAPRTPRARGARTIRNIRTPGTPTQRSWRDPGGNRDPEGAGGGGAWRPAAASARHGSVYRHGKLELGGFPVADISDHLADDSVTI